VAAGWPRAAPAQQSSQRIGILTIGSVAAPKDLTIVSELARLGYVKGHNVSYEVRMKRREFIALSIRGHGADEVINRGCGVESETCRQKIYADLGDRKR
jgi:hypothetical protein